MILLRSNAYKPCSSRGNLNAEITLLLALTVISLSFHHACCEQLAVLSEKSIYNISLKNYNVSDPDGESLDEMFIMTPESHCSIQITSIPSDVNFVMVQVHSFMKNMTLSYYMVPTRETSITGTNIGLIQKKALQSLEFFLAYSSSPDNATVMISVQAYARNAPIPGGCNMEFQVETSPFLYVLQDKDITEIDFAPADPTSITSFEEPFISPDPCNIKPNPVTYKMYTMYLPEEKLSQDLYFSSIKMMTTLGGIRKNGRLIPGKYGTSPMRYNFATYPGIGSVFVVVAETKSGNAVYVPAFSYFCKNTDENSKCMILDTKFSRGLCLASFGLGLFACFLGQKFFKTQLGLLGFLSMGGISYFSLEKFVSDSSAQFMSVSFGVVFGIVMVAIQSCRTYPILSLIFATTLLGLLSASTIFYKLTDYFDLFESDLNYWSIFISIAVITPILMVALSEKANIIACGFIGAYVMIFCIDYWIGSYIRFIFLNAVRRVMESRFRTAIMNPPFQDKDMMLTALWILVAAAGIKVQMLLVRGKPPYPPPPTERTPLLARA